MNNFFKLIFLSILPFFCYSIAHSETEKILQVSDYKWISAPKIPSISNKEIGCRDRKIFAAVLVNKSGIVQSAKVIRGSGNAGVDQRVEQALLEGTFEPYIIDGRNIPVLALQEVIVKYEEPLLKKMFRLKSCY
ncbi:energy transducer TonB [Acinetobacter pittii]|uniref:energy transducer TonB n=1 Tax=Acinetobacter pittii TaxID=48296 RepID=UPI000F85E369|nr:hypothetical protein [Acinetobacter pittii]RSO00916.1 hypothetical protein EA767_00500 [Acinetobacter pittii]